jgi:hypothetical protein
MDVMRSLGSVSWLRRSQARHILLETYQSLQGFRTDLAHPQVNELNADGALEDVDQAISNLRAVRRLLSPGPDFDKARKDADALVALVRALGPDVLQAGWSRGHE